jgi:transcription termination factor Rho
MSDQTLERSVLERKERDELHTIAEALGVKPGTRTKKADLIDTILRAAGVEAAPEGGEEKPKRAPRARKAATADDDAPALNGAAPATEEPSVNGAATEADVEPEPAAAAEEPNPEPELEAAAPATQDTPPAPVGDQPRQSNGHQQQRNQGNQPNQGNQGGGGGQPMGEGPGDGRRSRRRRGRDRDGRGGNDRDFRGQEQTAEQQYQGELIPVTGFLDLSDQGFGFLRTHGYLPYRDDVYVSVSQVRRFALRKGDHIEGAGRPPMGNEKYGALLRIDKVSGMTVEEARQRPRFEDLTPLFPDVKLKMEQPSNPGLITARIIDLISPIGKGQRGMIVSPPKAGKTTVIKQIATSIENNNPEVHLMVLLVDERPEEVTDMRRTVKGEVVASTFDRPSDEHTIVAELAIERAKRLVELGQDVVIILDGITRLARAYNLSAPASGRLTSGGIDQAAIYPPKKFFGAARNVEEGGSLTILATALVETGSKADDVIFEEFKGTGNMELRLDRRLAERRVYPAIDVNASSTRHEELLFDRKQLEMIWRLRRVLNGLADDGSSARSLELLIEKLKSTKNNEEFLSEVAKAQGAAI